MSNPNGRPENLVASHPGNTSPIKSGAFSRTGRPHAARAAEVSEWLMSAPHTVPLDQVAANEIGALVSLIEALDADIAKRGPLTRADAPRKILDLRLRASGRLERWLREFGATPASRAEFARTLAEGNLATEIARRRAQNGSEEP
jgi:hypothetical protein